MVGVVQCILHADRGRKKEEKEGEEGEGEEEMGVERKEANGGKEEEGEKAAEADGKYRTATNFSTITKINQVISNSNNNIKKSKEEEENNNNSNENKNNQKDKEEGDTFVKDAFGEQYLSRVCELLNVNRYTSLPLLSSFFVLSFLIPLFCFIFIY